MRLNYISRKISPRTAFSVSQFNPIAVRVPVPLPDSGLQIPDSGFSIHCKYSSKENVQKVFQKDCTASKGRACFQRHIPEIETDTGDKHKSSTKAWTTQPREENKSV